MGGLGVISAGFLAAGAALAAVPIVVHLLFRRKAPRVDLGSLRFLQVALRDNAHRRKVRRWLLLAIRIAGVLLLGLLFSRPYLSKAEVTGRDREIAILIDRSASMGAGNPARSPFARAKEMASKLISNLPAGTAVHLAFFDKAGVSPITTGKLDDAPSLPGASSTEFAGGLAWARDRVAQSSRKLREVHIFTDLQRVGLDPPPVEDFPEGIEVDVVDVGRDLRSNLAIVDALAIREEIGPGNPPILSAIVFNAGPLASRDVEVRLTLEGAGESIRLKEKIDVGASSRREVRFQPDIQKPGLYRGSVEVSSGDELPFDDRRWIAFEARRPEGVLLVDGEPGSSPFSSETYFLEAALRLRLPEDGPSATPFEPKRIEWDGGSRWPSLVDTSVVILANVPDVPIEVAKSLRKFVENGGKLVLFSGGKLGLGSLGTLGKVGLLPAEIEGTVDGPLRWQTWDQNHPMLRPFNDPHHGDLRSITFGRLTKLKASANSAVLASSKGGLPVLVESQVGQGSVLQWASAADNEWGDWAIQRLYLPVMHQMMGYLTGRLPGSGLVETGPIGTENTPGIEVSGHKLIIHNVDPSESRIDRAPMAEFRSILRLPEAVARPQSEPTPTSDSTSIGATRPGEFWKPIAWALLIILVVESFVANRTYA